MKTVKQISIWVALMLMQMITVKGQQLAFPGAEGYGKYASGGRGGRIVEVINLDDMDRYGRTIKGSLRAALETEGDDPITIVFKLSGVITLKSTEIKCNRSNITIAGQTAPGEGICIKNGGLKFSGNNLIIRYIRFRPGDLLQGQPSGLNIENAQNIIVDHCSFSWAIEENATFYDNVNTTVQWCIISEGLYDSYHAKGARGYGGQWGGQYSSYHHNLLAHNKSRSPRINGSRAHDTMAVLDFRNNVIFNWGNSGAIYGGEEEIPGGACKTNFVNNYYKKGPATGGNYFAAPSYVSEGNTATGYAQWYFSGNFMVGNPNNVNDDNWNGVNASDVGGIDNIKDTVEIEVSPVETHTAQEAYNLVLENAGAVLPIRDEVDERIVGEVKGEVDITGDGVTGENKGIIDSQSAVGGWPEYVRNNPPDDTDRDGMPDSWETAQGLNPADSLDGPVIQADGYSNLEHYLNSIDGIFGTEYIGIQNQYENSLIHIYPNPCTEFIQIDSEWSVRGVDIFDIQGKKIKEIKNPNKTISISELNKGTYFVYVYLYNGAFASHEIIVQ